MRVVKSAEEAVAAIQAFNGELSGSPDMAARLGQAHAFYVLNEDSAEPRFGFSKFVGYAGLTADGYLRDYKALNGRNTEHALSPWFEEVRHGSPPYRQLYDKLSEWMAAHGKQPRGGQSQNVRLMVLKPEFRQADERSGDDRKLLELLIAVADMLPSTQRHELRAAL